MNFRNGSADGPDDRKRSAIMLPEMSTMRKAEDKLKGILPYALKRAIKIKMKK